MREMHDNVVLGNADDKHDNRSFLNKYMIIIFFGNVTSEKEINGFN